MARSGSKTRQDIIMSGQYTHIKQSVRLTHTPYICEANIHITYVNPTHTLA